MINEYIRIGEFKHLIGKRARFKNNLSGYCKELWLKEGVIIQHEGLEHVGLSLEFDNPDIKNRWGLKSCYIREGSYELLEVKE